ncbi:MAG TPA: TonB family protein [Bryobacteraceae bacterium]|nr:TonB family protein [Bryobacteraceae bacterium]
MSSSPLGSQCLGTLIDGKFVLLEWLGGTEHSGVFRTQLDEDPLHSATIKLIPAPHDSDSLLSQWAAAQSIAHPHLATLFHYGQCSINGAPFLYCVSEYASETLADILPTRALTSQEARQMLGPVLDALNCLHVRNLVHGALKPSNVLDVDDKIKLTVDAVRHEHETALPASPPSIYLAPELARGEASCASDIWSLGVLLVEALTQRRPAWDSSGEIDPIVPATLSLPLLRTARACLRIDPARRCSLSDIRGFLNASGAHESLASIPTAPALPKIHPPAESIPPLRSRRPLLVGAVVLAALIGSVAALLTLRPHSAPPPSSASALVHQPAAPPPAAPVAAQPVPVHPMPTPSSPPLQKAGLTPPAAALAPAGAVTHQVLPNAPQNALATIRGTIRVSIRVTVDAKGNVAQAAIDTPGPSHYFANLALQAAQDWKFRPAPLNDGVAPVAWLLQFEFSQTGVDVAPAPLAL